MQDETNARQQEENQVSKNQQIKKNKKSTYISIKRIGAEKYLNKKKTLGKEIAFGVPNLAIIKIISLYIFGTEVGCWHSMQSNEKIQSIGPYYDKRAAISLLGEIAARLGV
ncbi:MAG: hypothetical protein ACRC3Z_01580 [Phocaeicola sp.]